MITFAEDPSAMDDEHMSGYGGDGNVGGADGNANTNAGKDKEKDNSLV